MLKRLAAVALAGLVSLGLAAAPQPTDAADNPRVRLATNVGDIVVELDAARAPQTVENFLAYVRGGHYDGTIFHRVIRNFMIQGGGFTPDMGQKPTRRPIPNEADNGLRNLTGTIAMARTNDPHSATAQFFINVRDNGPLDHVSKTPRGWGYAVFGRVVEGMDVVRRIEARPTYTVGHFENVPREDVVIRRAEIIR